MEAHDLRQAWSKSFDLTGREASSIQSAAENVVFVREVLKLNLDAKGRTCDRLRTRYRTLTTQREILRTRLDAQIRGNNFGGSATERLDDSRRLLGDLKNLERAKRALDMEI